MKIEIRNIDMECNLFGRDNYNDLATFMKWYVKYEDMKQKVNHIKVVIEIHEKKEI
ncbi:MAG: hypothetical protein KKA81_17545 [Bacteroidetes bacterium]|nr:hypothetical protein [Bacteroidota bacterium]